MKASQPYHNIPQLFDKISLRIQQSMSLLPSIPEKVRVQLEYLLSSFNNCLNLLQQQTLFLIKTNQQLEELRQKQISKATIFQQKFLNSKIQYDKEINQLQNKNYKLTKEIQFLTFVTKGLKQELGQSKMLVKNVKQAGIKHVNNMIKDVQSDIRKSAEKICAKINGFRQQPHLLTLNTQQQQLILTKKEQQEKQLQKEQNIQRTQIKKSKKIETKLSKILQQQARRAEIQQKDHYIDQ